MNKLLHTIYIGSASTTKSGSRSEAQRITLEKKGFASTQPIIFKHLQIIANERLPYGNLT